jgi:hypothetical protein
MPNATLRVWWFTEVTSARIGEGSMALSVVPWVLQWKRPIKALGWGHASLEIPPNTYISWGGAGSVANDTARYGLAPQQVDLPMPEGGAAPFGLESAAMQNWYANWSQDPGYNIVTRNCCDCVVGALTAGGGLHYSQIGTKWLGYDGARTVWNWAQRVRDKIVELNRNWRQRWPYARPLIEAARRNAGEAEVDDVLTFVPRRSAGPVLDIIRRNAQQLWLVVPTLAEWKSRSAVTIGYRKEQILKIDELLARYDAIRNQDPGLQNMFTVGDKLKILKELLTWACDHLYAKRTSDRREAVLQFASAVWYEHNRIARENQLGSGGAPAAIRTID